jgi:hypothetical protein
MSVKFRLLGAALLLPIILSACDWGTSRMLPPDPDERDPRIGFAPPADRLSRHRLANGIRVLVLPEVADNMPASQFVHATLRLDVGANADPVGMEGLAEKTAMAVWAGLPGLGFSIEFDVHVAADWTDFSFRAPQKSLETALSYLHFGLAEAEFDADRLQLAEARQAGAPVYAPTMLEQAVQAYAQQPVAATTIPVAAMRRFYAEHYGSRHAIFAVTAQRGSQWLDAVAATLGEWLPQPALPNPGSSTASDWQPKVWIQHHAGAAGWLAFAPAPRWDHPDMAGLLVSQQLLQNEQWTIQWRAGYSTPGWFLAAPHGNQTPNPDHWRMLLNYLNTADATLAQASEAQLQRAMDQASSLLQHPDGSPAQRLRQALLLEYHGYPRNFVDLMQWSISKLSLDDVRSAVRRQLRPLALSFYGQSPLPLDVAAFEPFGETQVTGEAQATEAAPAAALEPKPMEVDESKTMENLVDELLAAHGGNLAWQAADLFTLDLRRVSHSGKPPSRAQLVFAWPESLRYQTTAARSNAVVVNGDSGWLISSNGSRSLSLNEIGDWHDLRQVLLAPLLMGIARGTAVINERDPSSGNLVVSLNTGRSVELRLNGAGRVEQLRAPNWRVEYLSYQQADGLWLPQKLHFYSGESSSRWEQWELSEWHLNPPRQTDWFEPPSDF